MTNIKIEKAPERITCRIKTATVGSWYKIVDFTPNPHFKGKVGIVTEIRDEKMLILVDDGDYVEHDAFVLEKINNVDIKLS